MLDFHLASPDEIVQALGQRLRAQRLSRLMPQEELARRAGVAVGSVKKLEASGNTTLQTFVRVVQALALTDEIAVLLQLKPSTSIAAMESAELAQRKRARRPSSKP